jgi:hypothetical protein
MLPEYVNMWAYPFSGYDIKMQCWWFQRNLAKIIKKYQTSFFKVFRNGKK